MRIAILAAALALSACATIKPATEADARDTLSAYQAAWVERDPKALREILHPDARPKVMRSHRKLMTHDGDRSLTFSDVTTYPRAGYTAVMARFHAEGFWDSAGLVRFDVVNDPPVIWRFFVDQSDSPDVYAMLLAMDPDDWHPHLGPSAESYLKQQRIARTADLLTTAVCMSIHKGAREGNPILAPVFKAFGNPYLAAGVIWLAEDYVQKRVMRALEGPPEGGTRTFVVGIRWAAAGWNLSQCV